MSNYQKFCPNCSFGGCEAAEAFVADSSKPALKCPHFRGRWMYRQLPEGMKTATMRDFFEGDKIRTGLKYLLQSFYSGRFETYTASDLTNLDDLKIFIDHKKCFIKEKD